MNGRLTVVKLLDAKEYLDKNVVCTLLCEILAIILGTQQTELK